MHLLRGRAVVGPPRRPPTTTPLGRCCCRPRPRAAPLTTTRASSSPSSSSSSDDANGEPQQQPHHHRRRQEDARRAFADPHLAPLPPGSEHGEAFSAMAGPFGSGGARRLDVDALNEQLEPKGALRLRHARAPDEAHGAIFAFDSVVADLAPVKEAAWRLLAKRRGLPLTEPMLRAAALRGAHMPPDAVAARVFGWARNWQEGRVLALEHAALGAELLASEGPDLLTEALAALDDRQVEVKGSEERAGAGAAAAATGGGQGAPDDRPLPPLPQLLRARDGAAEWLDALARHGVPLAAVSSLDRRTLQRCLDRVGLHDHFDALVTADDEPESLADRLLMASLKLRRPPNACASFGASPEDATAAHNASMRCVAVVGGAAGGAGGGGAQRHALRAADLTVFSMRELSVINVRRLFAGSDAPGRLTLAREAAERERPGGGGKGAGEGGDGGGGAGARWSRWSTRRAVVAAVEPPY